MQTNTFYRVDTYIYDKNLGYDRPMGSGPGGKSLEEAYKRVREDITRFSEVNPKGLKYIKFKIEKNVTTTEIVEEVKGSEASFFLLKNG